MRSRCNGVLGVLLTLSGALLTPHGSAAAPSSHAQHSAPIESLIPSGYSLFLQVDGDLNSDGLADALVVLASQSDPENVRPLLVLLRSPAGGYALSARAEHAIPEGISGGVAAADGFDELKISNNTFSISHYGGSSVVNAERWQFRFQQGDWYLIGETYSASGFLQWCPPTPQAEGLQCTRYEVDTNLLTGTQMLTVDYVDGENDLRRELRYSLPERPLVRLVEFTPGIHAALP